MIKVRTDLHDLKDKEILTQKGKGKATYYIPGEELIKLLPDLPTQLEVLPTQLEVLPTQLEALPTQLPDDLKEKINLLGRRSRNTEDTTNTILELCSWKDLSLNQLATILNKNEKYLKNTFIQSLRKQGKLEYTIPEMPNHPKQTYRTVISK
jgi:ATP-dependent DNA helicase RecG